MATLAFVLLFVALGIGVLFVALSGGKRSGGKVPASKQRVRSRLGLVGFALAILVLGVAVPAAVIATVGDRDSVPESNVSNLTDSEKNGRVLFGQACGQCHTLSASNTVAQVGPNLDELRPPKALVLDAIKNGRARGNGQMAADLVENENAENVANYVAKAVGQAGQ